MSYHSRCARLVRAERSQVVKDPEGREGEAHEGRANQREVGTKELGHALSVDVRRPRAMTEAS